MPNEIQILRQELESLRAEFYRNNFSSLQDFAKTSRFNTRLKVPTYGTAPTTCEIGELYVNTGTGKAYVCSAVNTWTIIGTQS